MTHKEAVEYAINRLFDGDGELANQFIYLKPYQKHRVKNFLKQKMQEQADFGFDEEETNIMEQHEYYKNFVEKIRENG